ncbi:alkaline phosphatase D family protein [Crocosphaera sp. UHCC 0190]|uniref:alkaline phosphatase D family protein n=1 Tax=Crocosphaera sp. UHCC 0190 TaxID=3110246 RepID=UPI002B20BE77|nr:alkaline phosphatase D family protein [Crocosphaera sp. UHCC 0190]MEA5509841.1 alkaline phosphatase D family protein [Crocosphaera sp. UHCC 0190]
MINIASGDTTQQSTVLWGQSDNLGDIIFEYSTDPNFQLITGKITAKITDAKIPVKVKITQLKSGTQYYYRVTDSKQVTNKGKLITAADQNSYQGLRFGVSGDNRGELSPYPSIENIPNRNLSVFILHGDTIYADYPSLALSKPNAESLEEFRLKYGEVYGTRFGVNSWEKVRETTSILATIDDHEVINDFAGGADVKTDPRFKDKPGTLINESSLYKNGLQAFQEYHPLEDKFYGVTGDTRTANKRQLYRFQTYGKDAAIIVLDNRSFRDSALRNIQDPTDKAQVAQFLVASFNSQRTMLGKVQLKDLKNDLLAAEKAGITWKFIMVPEPIQNLGVTAASDRFEGYAAERTEILKFIKDNNINNVVFVAADIHGTVVNNLTYQEIPGGQQIPINAFEITTGSIAFYEPLGPTAINIAAKMNLLKPQQIETYQSLPIAQKEAFVKQLLNQQIIPLGYDPVGLDYNLPIADGLINAKLLSGNYTATHTFGWTEFEIDRVTQKLTVTTYGINPYSQAEIEKNTPEILNQKPEIVSQFEVTPSNDKVQQNSLILGITMIVLFLIILGVKNIKQIFN